MPVRVRLVVSLCLGAWMCAGCSFGPNRGALMREVHPPLSTADLDRPLSPDAVRADLDFLIETLDEVHPNAFTRVSRDDFVASLDSLGASLTAPRTRVQLFLELQPIVARLRDGHTSVQRPWEEQRRQRPSAVYLPVPLDVTPGALLVRRDAAGLAAGDTISVLDGVAGPEWARRLRALRSGESAAMQAAHVTPGANAALALFDADGGSFELTAGGQMLRLDAVPYDTLAALADAPQRSREPGYHTRPDGVGVLTVPSFSLSLDAFARALDAAAARALADGARGLIVDVRSNPGGDARNVSALVDRLTDRPYRLMARTEHRRSRQYARYWPRKFVRGWAPRAFLRVVPVHRFHPASRRYYAAPVGSTVVTEVEAAPPSDVAARFAGPLAVLTSAYSASAAVVFAATVQDHGLGTVVGQETGEWATMHGEALHVDLPNARLMLSVSTYRVVRPSGSEAPGGVVPDVIVPLDDAVERAAAQILGADLP